MLIQKTVEHPNDPPVSCTVSPTVSRELYQVHINLTNVSEQKILPMCCFRINMFMSFCIHFELMPSFQICFMSSCIVYNVVCHLRAWARHKTGETPLD